MKRQSNKSKNMLIVEENEGILDAMQVMLEMEGYQVKTTIDSKALYDRKKKLPDLLLLAIWMLGMDGRVICKFLKGEERTRHIPSILMSASKNVEKTVYEVGADDFFSQAI